MTHWLHRFWREQEGQDLVEYTLLITFFAIATLWAFTYGRPAVNGIWSTTNSELSVGAAQIGAH
jgi:Flp pilus assembly pilin Flp